MKKWCPRCRRYLALDKFNKNRAQLDGLNSYCRDCQHESMKEYRESKLRDLLAHPDCSLHGHESGYSIGCRCDRCKAAASVVRYRRTMKKKEGVENGNQVQDAN